MTLNFLKIFFRNQKNHKVISAINLAGLTIGILSSLFIFEYVFYERSFDGYHEKGERVCRISYDRYQDGKLLWETANSFYPIGKWLTENYTEVEDWATIVRKFNISVSYENSVGNKVFYNEAKTYYASNSLFNLFTIPLVEGVAGCIEQPNTVAISQRAAKRYFGNENPLGKVLVVDNSEQYTVTAVYKNIPANSCLKSDFLFSLVTYTNPRPRLNNEWRGDFFHNYLLLAPGVDCNAFCDRAMPELIKNNYEDIIGPQNIKDVYHFIPIPNLHLTSDIEYETEPPGNEKTTNILFWFALFLLAVAWINYVNLVTARSLERAREIGIKKINGALKRLLISQFLCEAVFFNLICLAFTLLLFSGLNPFFKRIANIQDFNLFEYPGFIRTALAVLALGTLISGTYPAWVLSSFKPIAVLKGRFKNTTQGLSFRKGLVTVQFVISIALLIGTLVTFRQASYLLEKDMGVSYESGLVVRAPRLDEDTPSKMRKMMLFKNRVLEMPAVSDFTFSSDIPGEEIHHFFGGYRKGMTTNEMQAFFSITVDPRFNEFYRIRFLAGRDFFPEETYENKTIILNKLAIERFGFFSPEEAVNQIIIRGRDEWEIVGVVDDFYFKSIKNEPVPTIMTLNDGPKTFLTLRVTNESESLASVISNLQTTYGDIFPGQPFEYFSLDDKMRLDLKPDKTFAVVFTLFSILAIFIAVIGIVGLVLITINQNVKELGIRKALGAEITDVSKLLSSQLLLQFVAGIFIAIPLSYYGYKNWFLSSYINHIQLDWWFFAVPIALLSGVIAFVVITLAHRVFRMNLREVLQYE